MKTRLIKLISTNHMNFSSKTMLLGIFWRNFSTLALVFVTFNLCAGEIDGFETSESDLKWRVNDGKEFPGATGSFDIKEDATKAHEGHGYAVLSFDFNAGGAYTGVNVRTRAITEAKHVLTFWVKSLTRSRLKIRIIDSTGQVFDVGKIVNSEEWEKISINVLKTKWEGVFLGAGDREFHFPSSMIFIGICKSSTLSGEFFLDSVNAVDED